MERYSWSARVLPGMLAEYIRRHDAIWPEMTEVLNRAGIRNYTIWVDGDRLFGYYECDSIDKALQVQGSSPIVAKWNAYMQDVMGVELDDQGAGPGGLRQVFFHEGLPEDSDK